MKVRALEHVVQLHKNGCEHVSVDCSTLEREAPGTIVPRRPCSSGQVIRAAPAERRQHGDRADLNDPAAL